MDIGTLCVPTTQTEVRGWKLKNDFPIGEKSAGGKVYSVCKGKDCEYVIKIMRGKRAV